MQRIYITGTALVLTMALSTPVFAQGNPARQRPPRAGDLQGANTFGGMLRGIDLTPEQRQKLEALRAQHRRDAGLGNAEGTLARDSAQLDSVRGRPMAMRARSDSAPRRADGMRALPDSARQRPAGARARGDSARLRPAGARTQPDSPRAGIRPRRTPDQAPQRSDPPDPEEIARVQRLREQTIADLRSVLTPQQRIQFEKNLREMQAQSVRKRPG